MMEAEQLRAAEMGERFRALQEEAPGWARAPRGPATAQEEEPPADEWSWSHEALAVGHHGGVQVGVRHIGGVQVWVRILIKIIQYLTIG